MLEASHVSMLAPYLPPSEPGRAGCIRLMGHPPSLGPGGVVAQPWQDSCCPTALQHPQIWVWSIPSCTLCPMPRHCPGTLGFPNWPWRAWLAPQQLPSWAACASLTSMRWEHPGPQQPPAPLQCPLPVHLPWSRTYEQRAWSKLAAEMDRTG